MDIFDQLGTVASCILRADDEIIATLEGPGFQVLRGSQVVEVTAEDGPGRVTVSYPFSVSGQLAQRMSPEEAGSVLTEQEQSQLGPEEAQRYAARKRVATLDGEAQQSAVKTALGAIEPSRSRTTTATVRIDEQDIWDGLVVYDYLYPTDSGFGPTAYDDTVTQVITEGRTCGQALLEATPFFDDPDVVQ